LGLPLTSTKLLNWFILLKSIPPLGHEVYGNQVDVYLPFWAGTMFAQSELGLE